MTLLATGLALGTAYGLVGVAVAAVAQAARTLHLAIGSVLVAGTLLRLLLGALGVPDVLAASAGIVLGAAVSVLLLPIASVDTRERVLLPLVALAAAGVAIDAAVAATVGVRQFRPSPMFGSDPLWPALLVGLPAAAVLAAAVRWSRWGRRLRLVGGSREAAALAGISPRRTLASVLAVSGASAVAAGLVVAPITFVGAGAGPSTTVRGVAAAVMFGIGGPERAIVAGITLGLAEAAGQTLSPAVGGPVAVAVAVVAVLGVRGGELRRSWGRPW